MNKTEVFTLFRSFSKAEMKKFKLFLCSPYFNRSKKITELYEYLMKFYPMFSDIRLEREAISTAMYPDERFSDSTIRNLFSDLHKKALEFLTYENFKSSKLDKYNYLLDEVGRKNLKDEFEKVINCCSGNNYGGMDYSYFLNNHQINAKKFNFSYTNEKVSKKEKVSSELGYLENSVRNLLLYFLTELATHNISLIIYSRTYDVDCSKMLLKSIADKYSPEKIKEIIPETDEYYPIVEIYCALVKMYSDTGNIEHYSEYKKILYRHINNLSNGEKSLHIKYLSSYCIGRLQKGPDEVFSAELFDLYKITLNNECYRENKMGHLPHELYRSILLHSLRLRKYDWAASFINEYSQKVHPGDIENMTKFGKAHLYYNTGNYSGALENLSLIDQDFFIYKFDVKNLTLMIYFELGYYDEALSLIKTYHEFLRKNKIITIERKKRYFSFIKFTEKLINHRLGACESDLGYIKYRLQKHNTTAFKPWLMEKFTTFMQESEKTA